MTKDLCLWLVSRLTLFLRGHVQRCCHRKSIIADIPSLPFQHTPRSWIEANFSKRECIKFIPSPKDEEKWVPCSISERESFPGALTSTVQLKHTELFLLRRVIYRVNTFDLIARFFLLKRTIKHNFCSPRCCHSSKLSALRENVVLQNS